ncbi:MAG TPA: hypothetical protein VH141_17300 [Pseudonocardia sp.]|nr:hypothetical protein [Pseudonocardia sp.]
MRGLVVAFACAVGAVLGLGSANLADATLAACGGLSAQRTVASGQLRESDQVVRSGVTTDESDATPAIGHRLMGVVCDQREEPASVPPGKPFVATATRHLPASPRALPPGVENPVTDRAMALVIGWAMLALIGGGLFVGRRPRRVADPEL